MPACMMKVERGDSSEKYWSQEGCMITTDEGLKMNSERRRQTQSLQDSHLGNGEHTQNDDVRHVPP